MPGAFLAAPTTGQLYQSLRIAPCGMRWLGFPDNSIKKIAYVSPARLLSLAARARLQPPHGAREPTARVACSGEAVQGCAKANANRIELVELENVIGDHPRAGLD